MLRQLLYQGILGIRDGAAFRFNCLSGRHMQPTFMVFQLTNQCNSRCAMCGIWKKKPGKELSAGEIARIFRNRLFSGIRWINLTGGEPFLRQDFSGVLKAVSRLPRLEGVAIPSNGLLTDVIVGRVEQALKVLGRRRFLSVTLSVDGFEPTHDAVRGIPGAYQKVMATFDRLLELKGRHQNFNVGVQPTITKANLSEIEDFYRFMKKKTASVGFAVSMESKGYYDNKGSGGGLSAKDRLKIADMLERISSEDPQYAYYYMNLARLYRNRRRGFVCLAGYLTLFMDPGGNIYPCPVLSSGKRYLYANATKSPDAVWFSGKASAVKHQLKTEPLCRQCSMMCDFINVAKVEFFEFAGFMLSHPKIFARLVRKMRDEGNPYF